MAQPAMHGWLQVSGREPGLQQCRLLNASICEASTSLSERRQAFQVVLYNPLAWERPTEPIRVPVAAGAEGAGWTVTGVQMPPACLGADCMCGPPCCSSGGLCAQTQRTLPDCRRQGRQALFLSEWPGTRCAHGVSLVQSPAA